MSRFRIGGELDVCRLGFGAMHLSGPGLWGEPEDADEARRVLRRLPELGVNLIDTADSYGPGVSERLIGEELGGHRDIVVATKAGFVRPNADDYSVCGDPDHLRRAAEASRARLGVERIDLWQLHRIDPVVSATLQFEAIARMIEDGVIRHAGLSHVTVAEIEAARGYFPVATVQNRYNLIDRASEAVLDYCEAHAIGFMPFYPLAAGRLTRAGAVLGPIAQAHDATASQVALAWLLQRSPVMLPIPGTRRVANLEDNAGALTLRLTDQEFAHLDAKGLAAWTSRA
ncbi:MAG TPA: aldo/keto reductase [Caulobacteraceae bacterium]|jgi:aryl-alcohol dehydrogenase-like predicted oxidoreductase|nr:aldo/keto reductase [Caulobacteraceae bacterium]